MHHHLYAPAAALASALALPAAPSLAAETSPLPSTFTIHIKNFMFVPMTATIRAGDRVTFVNDDDEAHTATANDKTFDSTGLDSGQRWEHVFSKPGTVTYYCELHPYMKATITVVPAASGANR